MPTVNVEEQTMDDIEEIMEEIKWNPSKRDVVRIAVRQLKHSEIDEHGNN